MPARLPKRVLSAGTVGSIGLATFLVHLYHLTIERGVHSLLVGVAIPIALSTLLTGVGVWLYRSEFDDGLTPRFAAWTVIGLVVGVAFGYPVVPYEAAHGIELVDVRYLLASWVTTGALGGFVVGFYDARQRASQAALEAERAELAARERELARQNDRLEQFAGVASHDLRNPLNVAEGRLDLAREQCDSDHLDAARGALDRMETLIEDLLLLARQGRPIDEPEPVRLSTVVDRCWPMVATGGATLTVEDDVGFAADPDRLRQLLENLFRNAVEHGGDDVTVTVGALPDGFYVADDGPGIPEGEREAVFDSGYSTASEGTGFGLSIVAEIVEAHGWTVDVTDSEAGGARFEIRGVDVVDGGSTAE